MGRQQQGTALMPLTLNKIRRMLFPTPRELKVQRWRKDGGDRTLVYDFPLSPASTVLDVGGFEGNWSAEIVARFGCRAHVFEPVRAFADAIGVRFHGTPAIHVHALGLSAKTGVEIISLASDASSTFKGSEHAAEVQMVDVAEWLEEHGIVQIDVAKINIEGGEYDLLDRLIETGWHRKTHNILVQFHDFVPDAEARMERIRTELRKTHTATFSYRFVWECWQLKSA